ncbi:MAG TPA: HAMP domain-containing sensor histidine kinase [Streptosporangiaceae bacterium]|nr:HAMP domain-containing sensor histidine kinase [Streptosporangiaceae bacterium]
MKAMRPRWPRRAQLRTRVLIGVLLVTLIALAAFDVAAVTAARTYLIGQTDAQLDKVLTLYGRVAVAEQLPTGSRPSAPARPRVQPVPGATPFSSVLPPRIVQGAILQPFSVLLVTGNKVRGVSPAIAIRGVVIGGANLVPRLPQNLSALAASGHAATVPSRRGNEPLRIMAAPDPGRGITVAVTRLAGVDTTVGRLELILGIGAAAAALLVAGGVAWVMRRGLRPIETMASQADAIRAGDMTSRVSPHDPGTEVGRLGEALNGMLARIEDFMAEREASQEAARRFFADASHELRTPLASLRANAELYQQGALTSRGQVDEAMRRITLESQRMSGLVDDMLRLARLDQHPVRRSELVDLTGLVEASAERARLSDPERAWRACVEPGLQVTGDEELLRRAVDNLLANVRAHTPAGVLATITAAAREGSVVVEVSDDGPGVPAGQLPRIFDRFYRGTATSGRPGAGLGLAIVATVAGTHHGTAEAALNEPSGLRVTLTLPAASLQPAVPL